MSADVCLCLRISIIRDNGCFKSYYIVLRQCHFDDSFFSVWEFNKEASFDLTIAQHGVHSYAEVFL